MTYKEAFFLLVQAIENSEHGWNGTNLFPEDFENLLNGDENDTRPV